MIDGLTSIIAQLERQKSAIERALAALREVDGTSAPAPAAASAQLVVNKRSEAQKKRWAAKKASGRKVPPFPHKTAEAVPAASKGGMTDAGRKRLADAMKERWAVKRAASAVKKTATKKRAAKKA